MFKLSSISLLLPKNYISRKRAISPVIAVILLIGITVTAGGALFLVISNLNVESELLLASEDPISFKTTENVRAFYDLTSRNIDSFQVQISNPTLEPIYIDLANTKVYNATSDGVIAEWSVDSSADSVVLQGLESTTLSFTMDGDSFNSLVNSPELQLNDEIYIIYPLSPLNDDTITFFKSETFTIDSESIEPVFEIVLMDTFYQFQNSVYFYADDDETVTVNFQFAIWNFGSPDQAYPKTIEILIHNDTVFSIDDEFVTQFVTIPSSDIIGDSNQLGVCEAGEPCVLVTIPITKLNLTAAGVQRNGQSTYPLLISVSGEEFVSFQLIISGDEPINIAFPPDLQAGEGNGWAGLGGLVWQGAPGTKESVTLPLRINVTNGSENRFIGNLFLTELNETVFILETQNITLINLPPNASVIVEWNITRISVHGREDIIGGSDSPYILKLGIGGLSTTFPIPLYIQVTGVGGGAEGNDPSTVLHVNAMSLSASGNNNKLTVDITITDGNNIGVKSVSLIVTVQDSNGNSVQQWTTGTTGSGGMKSYSTNLGNNASGEYTVSVQQVVKTGFTWNTLDDNQNPSSIII